MRRNFSNPVSDSDILQIRSIIGDRNFIDCYQFVQSGRRVEDFCKVGRLSRLGGTALTSKIQEEAGGEHRKGSGTEPAKKEKRDERAGGIPADFTQDIAREKWRYGNRLGFSKQIPQRVFVPIILHVNG